MCDGPSYRVQGTDSYPNQVGRLFSSESRHTKPASCQQPPMPAQIDARSGPLRTFSAQAARPAANYRGTGNQQEAPTSLDAGAQRDYDATMGEPTTTSR